MKHLFTTLFIFATAAIASAQMPTNYEGKYKLPSFREGWEFQRYKNWVVNTIVYPEAALEREIEGRVVVAFIVDEDGVVRGAEAIESPDSLLSNELIRVVKSGVWEEPAQRWDPQSESYVAVKIRSVIPITFYLPSPTPDTLPDHLTYEMMTSSYVQ